jgi:hypothetical protein
VGQVAQVRTPAFEAQGRGVGIRRAHAEIGDTLVVLVGAADLALRFALRHDPVVPGLIGGDQCSPLAFAERSR